MLGCLRARTRPTNCGHLRRSRPATEPSFGVAASSLRALTRRGTHTDRISSAAVKTSRPSVRSSATPAPLRRLTSTRTCSTNPARRLQNGFKRESTARKRRSHRRSTGRQNSVHFSNSQINCSWSLLSMGAFNLKVFRNKGSSSSIGASPASD